MWTSQKVVPPYRRHTPPRLPDTLTLTGNDHDYLRGRWRLTRRGTSVTIHLDMSDVPIRVPNHIYYATAETHVGPNDIKSTLLTTTTSKRTVTYVHRSVYHLKDEVTSNLGRVPTTCRLSKGNGYRLCHGDWIARRTEWRSTRLESSFTPSYGPSDSISRPLLEHLTEM